MYDRIIFTFSERCNMYCPFCYGYFDGKKVSFEKCLKIIRHCYENGIRRISLAGGDPLLVEQIDELVDFAINTGMEVSMDTNAQMFNSHKHMELISKLKNISFPLDGPNAEVHDCVRHYKGSFDKVVDTIKLLENCISIRINTVVTKHNYEYLHQLCDFLKNYSVSEWHIYECISLNRGNVNYKKIYVKYDKYKDTIDRIRREKVCFEIEHSRIQERIRGHLYVTSDGILYTNDFLDISKYIFWGSVFEDKSFIKAYDYLKSGDLV